MLMTESQRSPYLDRPVARHMIFVLIFPAPPKKWARLEITHHLVTGNVTPW